MNHINTISKKHRCLICLGSNFEAEKNLSKAKILMNKAFDCIQWGKTIQTPAEENNCSRHYLNCMLTISTQENISSIICACKQIEKACGRTAESKTIGTIPIDIDLLTYDDLILRPDDMQKSYIRLALDSLPL